MRRVCVVITARPSYSRVKTVLKALQARPDVELQIIACASAVVWRYGRVADVIREDGFHVTETISSVVDGDSTAETAISTGLLLVQISGALERLKPDVVVTIADRHETLATAIAASYQHIPLCHIQGGEVTGSIDDKVRGAVTQLADIHCVSSRLAALRVRRQRFDYPGEVNVWPSVEVTGCPSIDLAAEAKSLGPITSPIIVLQHPVTNEDAGPQMKATIQALQGMECLYFWPGEDAGGQAMSKELRLAGIKPVRNKFPIEFLRMLLGSPCLVGNSSVGIRECSFLGVPVVNIGSRQMGRERGPNVLDVPHEAGAIRLAVQKQMFARTPGVTLYGDGKAGERIAEILASVALRKAA